MARHSQSVPDLVAHLKSEADNIEHLMVVYARKGSNGARSLSVGLSSETELSWFLMAKEWLTWLLFSAMTGHHEAMVAERAFLDGLEPEPGTKPQ